MCVKGGLVWCVEEVWCGMCEEASLVCVCVEGGLVCVEGGLLWCVC